MKGQLAELLQTLPQIGAVRWIGVRPVRGQPMSLVDAVEARPGKGLVGDRYAGSSGKREVTLLQWEHLPVIASLLGVDKVNPATLRRNIAVAGINLLALRNKEFTIGGALLRGMDFCQPCSKMETALGPGGYNAMRGHGGITAQVIKGGIIRLGDKVALSTEAL
jgi:Uncharacterized protein conserved in bacteria